MPWKQTVPQIEEWFEHMHRNPELSMQEEKTAEYIADLVRVGIRSGNGRRQVRRRGVADGRRRRQGHRFAGGFRRLADSGRQRSCLTRAPCRGVAHLCGHDGHTAMLLAAGEYLARTKNFNGTVRLIFQPAEETMEGGPAMIKDGLFERFPVDAVFGMHNMPGLELGKLYFTDGPVMAAVDNWEIELIGKGSHGAMPELGIDPVVAGSSLVMALQTIVARNVAPANSAVVTVGAFQAGQAGNVVAHSAVLAPFHPYDDGRGPGDGARAGAHAHDGHRRSVRMHVRNPRGRARGGAGQRPEETMKAYEIAKEAFGEEQRRLSRADVSRLGGLRLHAAAAAGHVLLPGQRRYAHGAPPRYVFNKDSCPSVPPTGWR